MTESLIAWTTICVFITLAAALDGLRRLRHRRDRPYNVTEWRAGMRKLDTVKPMASRIEGKPPENIYKPPETRRDAADDVRAVKGAARPRRGRCVLPSSIVDEIEQIGKGRG